MMRYKKGDGNKGKRNASAKVDGVPAFGPPLRHNLAGRTIKPGELGKETLGLIANSLKVKQGHIAGIQEIGAMGPQYYGGYLIHVQAGKGEKNFRYEGIGLESEAGQKISARLATLGLLNAK
ncbi:MAG: hypothetical protein ABH854_01775 [Candidatus Diapherotrites archaeon]